MTLNKIILIGYLGNDPKSTITQSGMQISNFSIATSEKFTDSNGNLSERTDWHYVTAFNKQAEFCNQYIKKGNLVYVEGKIRYEEYKSKDGIDKTATKIIADRVISLEKKSDNDNTSSGTSKQQSQKSTQQTNKKVEKSFKPRI